MAKKTTKREYFKMIMEIAKDNQEIVNFCEHEISLLDNKKNNKTVTANQQANEEYKAMIVKFLETTPNEMFTITQLIEKIPTFKEKKLTNQKVSALCKQLFDNEEISKTTDKKKSLFHAKVGQAEE